MAVGLEILCAAALVLPVPRPTAAPGASQGPSSAEALFEAGRTAYRLGHFEDAIDKWTRAYAEDPLPSFLFNIALAHRKQYELSESVEHLHQGKAALERFIAAAVDVSLTPLPSGAVFFAIDAQGRPTIDATASLYEIPLVAIANLPAEDEGVYQLTATHPTMMCVVMFPSPPTVADHITSIAIECT